MQPYKQDQHWVIARKFRPIGGNLISGTHDHPAHETRMDYDVWTGEKWWGQRSFAKLFTTEEEAERYLRENWEILEQS
jgi:hypothetical protein